MRRFLFGIADLLFPPHCHGCGEPILDAGQDFCTNCLLFLMPCKESFCQRCGNSGGEADLRPEGCSECRHRRFPWEQVVRHGIYEGGLRNLILRMKGRGEDSLAMALGREWGRSNPLLFEKMGSVLFFPIPRHWIKSFWLGNNPAEGVTRGLIDVLGGQMDSRSLVRIRPTQKQADLPKSLRRRNVRGAFHWAGGPLKMANQPVAVLVDDIMTTGSTAYFAAKTLKSAGFEKVVVAILARGKSRTTGPFPG